LIYLESNFKIGTEVASSTQKDKKGTLAKRRVEFVIYCEPTSSGLSIIPSVLEYKRVSLKETILTWVPPFLSLWHVAHGLATYLENPLPETNKSSLVSFCSHTQKFYPRKFVK